MLHRRRFLAFAAVSALPLRAAEDGFRPLFNGRDLTGWEGDPSLWLAEDGAIVGRSPGIRQNVFLATVERFENFILRLDVRLLEDKGNSGIQFRSEREPDSTEMIGYQADIGPGWWATSTTSRAGAGTSPRPDR